MIGLYGTAAHGHIRDVRDEIVGDHLSTAAVATDTEILLDDLSVFAETGGQALLVEDAIADELVTYTGFNADETGLVLSPALAANHDAGTTVRVYPQELNRIAYVQIDDADREPIPVKVPYSLKDRVPLGSRSDFVGEDDDTATAPEEALIRLEYREWVLVDVPRQDVQIDVATLDTRTSNKNLIYTFTDFLAPVNNFQSGEFVGVSSGAGATIIAEAAVTEGHRGVWELQTGTTTTGSSRVGTHVGTTTFGQGHIRGGCLLHVPAALSDGTNRYTIYFGIINDPLESAATRGAYIRYRDNLNSGAWQARMLNSGSPATDSLNDNGGAVTVVGDLWYLLEIEVGAAGDQADFYVNGVLKGSSSAPGDLPATGAPLEVRVGIEKSLGTTNRGMDVDYIEYQEELTTPR